MCSVILRAPLEFDRSYHPVNEMMRCNRSISTKVVDAIKSIVREIIAVLAMVFHIIFGSRAKYGKILEAKEGKEENKALIVMVHGLFSHPATWDPHINKVQKEMPGVDLYVPYVPKVGNCPLDEAVAPIYDEVSKYAKAHPKRKIVIMTHSNGSRIADEIEYKMRRSCPETAMMVSTLAGVHFGSSVALGIRKIKLDKVAFFANQTMAKELSYGSAKAVEVMQHMREALPQGTGERKRVFYAASEDLLVPDQHSSIPKLDPGEEAYIFHGQGHTSIISAACDHQVASCKEWVNQSAA